MKSFEWWYNKAFKRDSQRLAVLVQCLAFVFKAQWLRLGGLRCSPLNAALVANKENAAKAECLELKSVCFWLAFRTSILNCSGL
ncbi:hypothetical protein BTZ53_23545 [Vibrio parahaemolyticus]|nr:hypothetical protein BTZ53_23545 [Vibrio parahaemolyticus]